MMMVNVVMLVVRKGVLRCEFWAVNMSWMLYGPDVPRLRSALGICICVCSAFKYGGNALKEGREGIIGLTSTHRRRRPIGSASEVHARSRIPFDMLDIWLIWIWRFCLPGIVMM